METALEKRLENLEKQVAALTEIVKEPDPYSWRSSVGMLPQDEISLKADEMGSEWRQSVSDD